MNDLTLKDLIDAYLHRHMYKRRVTATATEQTLNKHVSYMFARKLSEIDITVAEALHQRIGERSPIQSNRVLQTLKAAWNKGIKWQLCSEPNPFALVEQFPENVRTRRLSASEVQTLNRLLQKRENKDLHDYVMLSLFTGVRRNSLLSMRWEHLNLEARWWIIPKTKNGTPQLIPLGPNELNIINSRKNDTPWVFPSAQGEGHMGWLYKSWRSLIAAAEIPYARPHDLRRSLAAAMADLNVSATIIQGAMNHKSLVTTMKVYAIAGKDAELEARQLVQQQWFNDLPEESMSLLSKKSVTPDELEALVTTMRRFKDYSRYLGWFSKLPLRLIQSESEYETAKHVHRQSLRRNITEPDERDYFEVLATLIGVYEQKQRATLAHKPPHEALQWLMREQGLTRNDLVKILGSKSTVSELLSGKHLLSKKNAQRLAGRLGVEPELFMRRNT
ncbi:MAG: tyrosine-type recombinase/integrase [Candidatus Obscuribacterales bacterium]|nr:tyrosine-type recombinase/integrase [Candidatus Obscuribacterales bacterium]